MPRHPVPKSKRVLNIHISKKEHRFLKQMAQKQAITMTEYVRTLIREKQDNPDG